MQDKTLSEAKKLYDLGFAVLVLHPKSKRPKGNKWTSGPRLTWDEILGIYREGDNIGVRTGTPSVIGGKFLACIDVDIKNPVYKDRAKELIKELLGTVDCPQVISGSGNGSRHFYCLTEKPFKMLTIDKSDDGEICVYSDGRQMVLPPSIHPSGKPYRWKTIPSKAVHFPVRQFKIPEVVEKTTGPGKGPTEAFNCTFTKVDLGWLGLSKGVLNQIIKGTGVVDRSAFLLTAVTALVSSGLDKDEVLSVLTDPENFISQVAKDRRGADRLSQAQWLWEYTVKKVLHERSSMFGAKVQDSILTDEDLKKQTEEILADRSWQQDLKRTGNGGGPPVGNVENVVMILTHAVGPDIVKRNQFAFRDTYGLATPWGGKVEALLGDDDVIKIKYWLGTNWGFEPKNQIIEESLIIIACKNAYDPVCDWLDGLPEWDKKPRLGVWLKNHFSAKGDDEYLRQVFTKWILAMVARAYQPGIKFDWMPIFEGKQGVGKSSFGRLLVGDKYFLDSLPNLTDKDSALALQGIWSVEMGELANMRRAQLEDVKSYVTRTVDKVRPPYGRRWQENPRRCVFFGTTNRQTYLVDDTGNRRFKPVEVGELDFKTLRKEREQLFAEAKHIYLTEGINPMTFELSGEAKIFEAKIHHEKMVEDESTVMKEAMEDFMRKVEKNEAIFDFDKFRILDLFGGAGPLNKWKADNRSCQFAAKMLKKFRGEKRLIKGLNYWKVPQGGGFDEGPDTPDFF